MVDDGEFLEILQAHAESIVIGLARLNGRPVGIVGNQPLHLAGVLDINASVKGARFVRCDAFNIPILSFVDVPGFMPGTSQKWGGIIRHGAKLLYAYAEATVPKLTVITRKAYGGAYDVMASKPAGRHELRLADGRDRGHGAAGRGQHRLPQGDREGRRPPGPPRRAGGRVHRALRQPLHRRRAGYIDEVIEPRVTRPRLIQALEMCVTKREVRPPRKHGSIPL